MRVRHVWILVLGGASFFECSSPTGTDAGAMSLDGRTTRDAVASETRQPDAENADALFPEGSFAASDARSQDASSPEDVTVGSCSALPASGTWENITPPGVTATGSIALDPFDVGTVWFGANGGPTGGVWKSTDCGTTWLHVNVGTNGASVDGADIWSMAVDFVDPGVLYVIGMYGPQGLWKSTDSGVDWVQLFPPGGTVANAVSSGPSNPAVADIGSISIDPTDHLHLVVGTHANCSPPNSPACAVESTDGGATWTIVNVQIPGVTGWLEQTGPYVLDATTWVYATLGSGLWLVTDDGATWTNVTPSQVNGAGGGEYTHRPFGPSPAGNYYLPGYGGQNGLLMSSDGHSWSYIPNSPNDSYGLALAVGDGKVYLGDFNSQTYAVASETDLSTWSTLPAIPVSSSVQGPQGPHAAEYDTVHHVLYSASFNAGLWRFVTGE